MERKQFPLEDFGNRYKAQVNDVVIGVIRNRREFYTVELDGYFSGNLDVLEFEGATKNNKPNLHEGDLVYCRVIEVNKYGLINLTCKDSHNKKS